MMLLAQDCLNLCIVPPKCCQLFLRDFDVFSAMLQTIPLAQFFGQQMQFALRAAGEFCVRAITFAPAAIDVGVADADIKWFLLVVVHFPQKSRIYAWILSVLNSQKQH